MKTVRTRILATLVALLSCAAATAQITTTTLFGTVTDTSGAVIPNATVTLVQTETNLTRTLAVKEDGSYRAEFLPVGPYAVKAEAAGFKTFERKGITLTVTASAQLDLVLTVGATTDTVIVTSELPLVNASNATLGRTVDNKEIDNLPLVNRNVYQLLTLTAGVQSATSANNLGYPEQHTIINGSSDGTVGQVSYYLDGGVNMSGLRNTGNILPNPDAIREFVVQTNNFSAQFGRTSAGIVTVLTKSGTNSVHGSVFEFNRNTSFNATTHGSTSKLPYHRNQFGATVGGPIFHDKAFFFGSYGGLRQSTSSPLTSAIVPTAAQRTGNFSANLPTSSGVIGTNCNQTLSAADRTAGNFIVCNPVTRQPYPGNLIPNSALDPAVQNIIGRNIPLPNFGATGWNGSVTVPQQTDEFLVKADSSLGQSHRVTASYFQTNGNSRQSPGGNLPWSLQLFTWRQQNGNLSDTWSISSRTVNQFWVGYSRILAARTNTPTGSLADFGSTFSPQGPAGLPQITVTGYFTLAQSIAGPKAGANVYSLRDIVSTTRGKHTLYFGAEGALEKDAQNTLLNNYGVFAFTASTSAKTGNALADFLVGRPNTFNQDAPVYANNNYWNYGAFAQDDYRITPRLTVNLGLRYDIQTPPTDSLNRVSTFKQGVQSTAVPGAILGQQFYGDPGVSRTIVPTQKNHFSPRIGFALDPYGNGRTIFHGAAGLFFGSIGGNQFGLMSNAQPFDVRAQYNNVVSVSNIYATDPTDFPGGVSPYPYVYDPKNPRYIKPASLVVFPTDYRWPYNYQLNFGVQQQITSTLALGVSYVGALARKLPLQIDHNYPVYNAANPTLNVTSVTSASPAGAVATNNRRPILPGQISTLFFVESGQSSNYHGLQVTIEKRLSHHLGFKGYYTWSKTLASAAMDNNSLANPFEDYNNPGLDKQRSDFDQRHTSVSSIVYQPDYFSGSNRYVKGLLNGWTLTAIVTLQSGAPFGVTAGSDLNADGNSNDRPNLIAGKAQQINNTNGSRTASMAKWFDTSAYCVFSPSSPATCPGAGPAGSSGTVRPNSVDAPGIRNIDASLFRDFGIYERVKFQFRTEVSNVFNLTNLGVPNSAFNSANFGKITGSASGFPNRQIQLGGRILF
ncbi:MAG: TonB-dependent receptor plug [Acidobacteriaceae bacterium]|nr:TonB-dependent receptor plug [Acidobacteriaceae bacterium]